MAENEVEYTVLKQGGETDKPIGMWQALCLILVSIAANIKSAGPIEMSNMFRVFFRSMLATILVIGGGSFLWKAAFVAKESLNEHTGVIVGFITASVIGVAVGFYFGGQDRSKEPESTLPNPPTDGDEYVPFNEGGKK